MKPLNTFLTRLLLVTSLMLPWAATQALETFQQAGVISKISLDGSFILKGKTYRVSAGAKLDSSSADRQKPRDLRAGDLIWCKGKILDGVYYVDIIRYEAPDES